MQTPRIITITKIDIEEKEVAAAYIVELAALIVGLFANRESASDIIPSCAIMGNAMRRQRSRDKARLNANHFFPSLDPSVVKNALFSY